MIMFAKIRKYRSCIIYGSRGINGLKLHVYLWKDHLGRVGPPREVVGPPREVVGPTREVVGQPREV